MPRVDIDPDYVSTAVLPKATAIDGCIENHPRLAVWVEVQKLFDQLCICLPIPYRIERAIAGAPRLLSGEERLLLCFQSPHTMMLLDLKWRRKRDVAARPVRSDASAFFD